MGVLGRTFDHELQKDVPDLETFIIRKNLRFSYVSIRVCIPHRRGQTLRAYHADANLFATHSLSGQCTRGHPIEKDLFVRRGDCLS